MIPNKDFDTSAFEARESAVRSYCRAFPAVFNRARGSEVFDEHGRRYLDFFAGAGALNYGHNPPFIRDKLVHHLQSDGVLHALDMYTDVKRRFIERFRDVILEPRRLDYKLQFCGPTGTNAVEAALKLARRITGRANVCTFSGGFHGMSLGSLSVTGNRANRTAAGVQLGPATTLPYPEGPRAFPDALAHIEGLLTDPNSGLDTPAAFIVETVQAEGGIYIAPIDFLVGLAALCKRYGILLVVDEVQMACGRTGPFFSFERAGIVPDLVCLSKAIGGCGLPMALVLVRPELDVWKPGDHTGTFRGNQLAFVAAEAALDHWVDVTLSADVERKGAIVRRALDAALPGIHGDLTRRGIGLIHGVDVANAGGAAVAAAVARRCFSKGLIIERCGRDDTVLKILPPLVIPDEQLVEGLDILLAALRETIQPIDRAMGATA
jgi:diaminobutyrate-2-oxoglutarate transaminase